MFPKTIEKDGHLFMSHEDILLLTPNTRTCPRFPSRQEFDISKQCYSCFPPFIRHAPLCNDWNASIDRYINVSDFSQRMCHLNP